MKNSAHKILPNPFEDIKQVETHNGFSASGSHLFANAEFGRDERQLAADALIFDPSISKKVVRALVSRQSWKRNDITEAQPGKFHHEHRELYINGEKVPDHSEAILSDLSIKWGGTKEKITYYGSFDVTPDAVSLIADLAQLDSGILTEKVVNQDRRKKISIKESARQGIQWVQDRILFGPTQTPHNDVVARFLLRNDLKQFAPTYHNYVLRHLDWINQHVHTVGEQLRLPLFPKSKRVKLLEFQRTNHLGIAYQGWMDGGTSLIHSHPSLVGMLADYRQPIATVEMQASAIDALEKAAFLFPKKAKHFRKLADEIRKNVVEQFWMEDKQYFAMGVDRDNKGSLRKIETLSGNVGEILNSTFFDQFLTEERQRYITAIVKLLFSPEFLTPAGIRTRAKSYAYLTDISKNKNQPNSLFDYWDYQGSETSWIVQTGRIAEGLRRQGFYSLAEQLDNRVLNTVNISGYNLEYVYVGAREALENVVAYNIQDLQQAKNVPLIETQPQIYEIYATNIPESTQTWTASRVAAILHRKKIPHLNPITHRDSWQWQLEQDLLHQLKQTNQYINILNSHEEIYSIRGHSPLFIVNKQRGKELEEEIKRRSEEFYTK